MQFGVFEKFTSACLFQIAREKSCDYLLIIYMKKCKTVKKKKQEKIELDLKAKDLIGPDLLFISQS